MTQQGSSGKQIPAPAQWLVTLDDGSATWMDAKFFVELDVAGLTRQVEESLTFLCQYAYDAGYTTGDDRTVTGKDVDLSVKATALKIVGLLLNQEKETK